MKNGKSGIMSSLPEHLVLGKNGENLSADILKKQGYKILERNWRTGRLEIDLICEFKGQIVFVEVKTRTGSKFGGPLGAVTSAKKKRLMQAAALWLQKNNSLQKSCRFDIICLVSNGFCYSMEHYCNVFDFMDCSNTSWQPF